jgi:hypothetical protein
MKEVWLELDQQERFNLKRAWFVKAYRLVDINGVDAVQPWFNNKTSARWFAKHMGWKLYETNRRIA